MTALHNDRIDLVIQYALLVAGEEDDYIDRDLGPIHLIKYVYLADLAFAHRNNGKTYTGAPWRFYNFGPWTEAVYERLEPATTAIGADIRRFPSNFGDQDWIRFYKRADRLLREKEQALPLDIAHRLRREIHKFGKDTPSLLDFVYTTKPMLRAAPNEKLDFSTVTTPAKVSNSPETSLRINTLSNKKRKCLAERIRNVHEVYSKSVHPRSRLINPVKNPRYDDVYAAGIHWLDSLAGEHIPEGEITVKFSPDVWKSEARDGDDVA